MEPILVYGFPAGSSMGLVAALEWLGKPYRLCRVDMLGEMRDPSYARINARHETPVLITDAGVLTETIAIAAWLEARDSERRISFAPLSPQADRMHQLMAFVNTGFTGAFSIRFTETGFPSEGYVNVEIENYTSLASYLHGLDDHNAFQDRIYIKRPGVPFLSRSRQVYRFRTYIPRNPTAPQEKSGGADATHGGDATHKVVAGDSLSALAKAYYNDSDLWPIIFDRNRDAIGSNADRIKVGQSLLIPAKQKLTPEQIKQAKQTARLRSRLGVIKVAPLR